MTAANLRGELRMREPMSRHTSWRAGGPADRYYRPADRDDLVEFIRRLDPQEPILWLGLGSNLLVRDGGFRGTVIALHGVLDHIKEVSRDGNVVTLEVEAGVHCARLAKYCAEHQLDGGAFFIGIPGTVGGALAMNAGAYGGETWQRVLSVEVLGHDGRVQTLEPSAFEIGYRTVKAPVATPCYLGAKLRFEYDPALEAKAEIRELLAARKAAQPVGQPSCGSVFRNPQGDHAARLIETSGLKGYRIGAACVSDKHANFILNTGEAKADDIERLIQHVQQTVKEQHGVALHPEVRIVGETGVAA
ncbi:MAG: UDP-N-acetylmuramate dehydrogenase [Salinisphaeraceae bacterium]|nr:UDP-N-acetylmuramate dehydrogenase [Salinisphaeraceae bacterium]